MSYYMIGIGGTGAKCLEAVTHMAAAGLIPGNQDIYTMFIDPDITNGSLERARETIRRYKEFRNIKLGVTDLLKNQILTAREGGDNNDVWSPVENISHHKLNDIFNYNVMASKADKTEAYLYDLLYTKDEQTVDLDMGFRGHPSIGAAVMANTMGVGDKEPWSTLFSKISNDIGSGAETKVFIFGSIFGGTGAAGFPTIAKLIVDHFASNPNREKLKLGGALILPYFKFDPPSGDLELKAYSEDFLMNTQSSLKYYWSQNYSDIYDSLYVMSDDKMSDVNFSIGAASQRNMAHIIEQYAAFAAIHFYTNEVKGGTVYMTAKNSEATLEWDDLPNPLAWQKIGQLARFSFAFLAEYYDRAKELSNQRWVFKAPWFNKYLKPKDRSEENIKKLCDELDKVKNYCQYYLRWLKDVNTSTVSGRNFNLINQAAYSYNETDSSKSNLDGKDTLNFEFKRSEFTNLVVSKASGKGVDMNTLWNSMSDAKERDVNASAVGEFVQVLYNNCKL